MDSLQVIKDSHIISQDDFESVAALQGELWDTFTKSQVFRTRTEMEISVLQDIKHPTADSKYWQAVREQNVMFHELVMLSFEYRKNQVEIRKLQRGLLSEKDDLEQELLKIEIEKNQFMALNQERVAKDRIREIREWSVIKQQLEPHLQFGKDNVNDHQLMSYHARFQRQAQVMGNNGSPAENINLLGQLYSAQERAKETRSIDGSVPQSLLTSTERRLEE